MIIANSKIGMESEWNYSSLRMDAFSSALSKPVDKSGIGLSVTNKDNGNGGVIFGGDFNESLKHLKENLRAADTSKVSVTKQERDAIDRIKTECINYLLRILFGKTEDGYGGYSYSQNKSSSLFDYSSSSSGFTTYSADSTLSHYYGESEEVTFNTKGTVVTADGREIDFSIGFSMSRSFEEYTREVRNDIASAMCDPLVINLDTSVAEVFNQKFLFDIDADGTKDSISMLGKGSGFLALDKNEDGIINDGNELFGTKTGDGFKDLAAYDSDGNGWIDEADPIFSKLKIYSMNADGSMSLYGLSEKNVGAIFLGNVSTNYSLNDVASNETNAAIRKSGVFLFENGNAGTIQHVDFAR